MTGTLASPVEEILRLDAKRAVLMALRNPNRSCVRCVLRQVTHFHDFRLAELAVVFV